MTFREAQLTHRDIIDSGIEYAIDLFKVKKPYTIIAKPSNKTTYIFEDSYIEGALLALTSDSILHLSQAEALFLFLFIDWQNYLLTDPENPIVPGSEEDLFESSEKKALETFNNIIIAKIAEE